MKNVKVLLRLFSIH